MLMLNLNLLGHRINAKVKDYFNLAFQSSVISTINNPTIVTKTNASFINLILKNYPLSLS